MSLDRVHHPRHGAGDFWVLTPIRFSAEQARFGFSYRRSRPDACNGGGTRRYRLVEHRWVFRGGSEQVGCGVPKPVPTGWHARFFRASGEGETNVGIDISNVGMPKPEVCRRTPVQVSSRRFPGNGVSIIVATDAHPPSYASVATLPLSDGDFLYGSASAGSPTLDVAWFRANGETYVVTVKKGASVSREDGRTCNEVIRSIGSA